MEEEYQCSLPMFPSLSLRCASLASTLLNLLDSGKLVVVFTRIPEDRSLAVYWAALTSLQPWSAAPGASWQVA